MRLLTVSGQAELLWPGVFLRGGWPVRGDIQDIALDEAAALNGAGPLAVFLHIGLPLGAPGILSAVVLGFLEYWNALEQPLTFLRDKTLWPLSLYLPAVTAENAGAALAASVIMLTPALLIFLFGQRYLEAGISVSVIKD